MNMRKLISKLFYPLLLLFIICYLSPIVWLFLSSVKTNQEISKNPWAVPTEFRWENFQEAWQTANLSQYFVNSLLVGVSSSIVTIFIGAMAAFALSRLKFKKANFLIYQYFLLGLLIPVNALLIPLYLIVNDLYLYGSHWALILTYTAFNLPITIFILVSFMVHFPSELEEAGIIDGCGIFRLFWNVLLPITRPALATVLILNLLNNWNEFILALLFNSNQQMRTVPVGLANFASQYQVNYATLSAGALLTIFPIIVMFIVLQKQVIEGMSAGAVKG
ncbi:carbohydrate ABC transporter permease [Bacillus alkalicellulosilyticus]|uniref:carbohydrate ABC transporter permease n=1 Tax=Alkalihalobacterium alkalicellulosilyticum TaxID=1912214 RepID=UPI000996E97C|nr:carbohydrate ABC transporter permease [Bacillus alkalicellulosilyticus]